MTKRSKIVTGIIGAAAVVSSVLIYNAQTGATIKHYPIGNELGVNLHPWDMIKSNGSYGPKADKLTADLQLPVSQG
jgi:hypothetical protein